MGEKKNHKKKKKVYWDGGNVCLKSEPRGVSSIIL